jgi:hypothetical protein
MATEIGFGVSRPSWRIRLGIDTEDFSWTPGEYESGTSSPPQFFDYGCSDAYWVWVWLWFKIFFVRLQ